MKLIFVFLIIWGVDKANAVPIFNENASGSGLVTIYPDSADSNLFYIAPNVMKTCKDVTGKLQFSYSEYRPNWYDPVHAIIQLTVCPEYSNSEIDTAKIEIQKRIQQARFSGLPYMSSEVQFNPVLAPFVVSQSCTHAGATIGVEESCSIEFNGQGRKVFLAQVQRGLAMVMQFNYEVAGVLRNANMRFDDIRINHSVAIRIGGEEFRGLIYPKQDGNL
jgi:hypothetical protein